MSETKMKLEIEFESFEDLDRKLSSALRRSEIFKPKSCYSIEDIKKCIKLYDIEYENNYFYIIKNGMTISKKISYTQLINKLSDITWNKDAFIIQNPDSLYDIYVFVYR
jgi:hypothetical protein